MLLFKENNISRFLGCRVSLSKSQRNGTIIWSSVNKFCRNWVSCFHPSTHCWMCRLSLFESASYTPATPHWEAEKKSTSGKASISQYNTIINGCATPARTATRQHKAFLSSFPCKEVCAVFLWIPITAKIAQRPSKLHRLAVFVRHGSRLGDKLNNTQAARKSSTEGTFLTSVMSVRTVAQLLPCYKAKIDVYISHPVEPAGFRASVRISIPL